MKRSNLRAALFGALLAAAGTALAVGTEFTWQGELRESGLPATGTYDLEFRLFAAASGGSPLGPVRTLSAQAINGGIYTALLDFGDQFTGEPRWLEISVRRSGQPAFTPLLPRQPLTATPYAQHADFVADNSIVGANIVDGSVGGADLAAGGVSTTQIANGGVQTIDLADGSVATVKLADAAVTTPKIAAGAVTTPVLADASVNAEKLAPGAVGSAQINDSQVQRRVGARCPTGLPLVALESDGSPLCDDAVLYLGANLTRPRLALDGRGSPRIAAIDQTLDNLVFASCGDSECSDGTELVVLDASIGASTSVAMALRGTAPFVAYHDAAATDLHAFDCAAADCNNRVFRSLDTTGNAGVGLDIALRSGNLPAIAYLDADATPELRLYDCDDSDCASGSVRVLDASDVDASTPVTVTLAAGGQPIVFYRGTGASEGLNVYACANADCTLGASTDLTNDQIAGIDSVTRVSGLPLVVYTIEPGDGGVFVFDCTSAACTSGVQREFSTSSITPGISVVAGANGFPLMAYHSASALRVFSCTNTSCTTGTESAVVINSEYEGFPSLDQRSDGRPVLASEWTNLDGSVRLRIDTCGNAGCRQ
jgi:hypothetical protein